MVLRLGSDRFVGVGRGNVGAAGMNICPSVHRDEILKGENHSDSMNQASNPS